MRFLLTFSAFALCACAQAQEADKEKPALELTGRVVDAAEILTPQFEDALTSRLANLEAKTDVQLVVVTTPTLNGFSVEAYSLKLANAWGIGNKDRDDGLMILVAPNERRTRIEVGRGLETLVTNEEAAKIIEENVLPPFRKSNYESGLSAGVKSLILEVTPADLKEAA